MARPRLILVSYGFLYLEKNFDFYETSYFATLSVTLSTGLV